jgi:LPXTG-motif cell wall-anchored protein
MSTGSKQALVLLGGGLVLFGAVVWLLRRRLVTLRYALGWLTIAVVVMLGALFTGMVSEVGDLAGMTPTAVFLLVATVILLAITIQLSISVSGLQAQVQDLAEACAMLEAGDPVRGDRSPGD